ncbi:ATP-dependent RNA helicase DDX52/ROK1, partial [Lecanoromycetidae sp. Uapishka_2]
MDMFKLLTRSTNIQKSAPAAKKVSRQHIPSAGSVQQNHEDHGHQDWSRLREVPTQQGVKRKRGEVTEGYDDGVPGKLNFFGDKAKPPVLEVQWKKPNALSPNCQQPNLGESSSTKAVIADLDEAECQRILKKNKVKITILRDIRRVQPKSDIISARTEMAGNGDKRDPHVHISPQPLTSFGQLRSIFGISRRLAENIDAQGYKEPTEVQLSSLPLLLGSDEHRGLGCQRGRNNRKSKKSEVDLLTIAPTGSGKTLGFMIHLLHGLVQDRQSKRNKDQAEISEHQVRALIIAPTHELADQIVNEGKKLAIGTGIKVARLKKGMKLHRELLSSSGHTDAKSGEHTNDVPTQDHDPTDGLLVKSDILVSTPLILLHAVQTQNSKTLTLPFVRFLVLDEADVLLDPLFREQTLGIWEACSNPNLQTSLWSATIGSSIESLAQTFILDRRRRLELDLDQHSILRLVVGLKDSAVPNITHRLTYAASEQGKLLALRQLLHPSATPTDNVPPLQPPFLVFTQTIPRAIALHSELLYDIPPEAGGSSRIAVLHSDLSDAARSNIMAGFRKGEIWIVITTDLLSRGMDFRGLNGVVNYDIPNTGASYIHRVGRTGRQGREGGIAVTLYTKEDIPYVKNIANVIASSEKAREKNVKVNVAGVQKWLLDALPNVSKNTRNELKNRGVESRRTSTAEKGGREARKMRISTKSGYDRRLENKKKGAVTGSQRRMIGAEENGSSEDEEWGGIND